MFSNLTGLRLHPLAPENEDSEQENDDDEDNSDHHDVITEQGQEDDDDNAVASTSGTNPELDDSSSQKPVAQISVAKADKPSEDNPKCKIEV
jgi:hypothetical protein